MNKILLPKEDIASKEKCSHRIIAAPLIKQDSYTSPDPGLTYLTWLLKSNSSNRQVTWVLRRQYTISHTVSVRINSKTPHKTDYSYMGLKNVCKNFKSVLSGFRWGNIYYVVPKYWVKEDGIYVKNKVSDAGSNQPYTLQLKGKKALLKKAQRGSFN